MSKDRIEKSSKYYGIMFINLIETLMFNKLQITRQFYGFKLRWDVKGLKHKDGRYMLWLLIPTIVTFKLLITYLIVRDHILSQLIFKSR